MTQVSKMKTFRDHNVFNVQMLYSPYFYCPLSSCSLQLKERIQTSFMALSLWVGNITLTVTVLLLLPSFLLNWKNVSNFFQAHVSGLEHYTVTARYLLSWFLLSCFFSLLKLKECIKLLSWPMPLSWEYYLFTALLYCLLLTLSS